MKKNRELQTMSGKDFKLELLKEIMDIDFPNDITSNSISISFRYWDGPLEHLEFHVK